MPLTNAAERRSAVALSYHYYGPGVTPDATPGVAWRQQSGHGYSGISVAAPVEVPDVVGETEAAGTIELETALFVVSVATAYSPSIAAGLIISQSPTGGSFAAEGSTVTITVSLGPEPVSAEPVGGHYWPTKPRKSKDYRSELDEKRLKERQELRELIERAAGLIEEAEEVAPAAQVVELKQELRTLAAQVDAPSEEPAFDPVAMQARVDELIAKSVDDIVDRIADLLTELIQEIAEDD